MELECVFFGPLRDAVGQKTVRYETAAETAGELLAQLRESYPELQPLVEDGALADGIVVTHNGKHLRYRNGGRECPSTDFGFQQVVDIRFRRLASPDVYGQLRAVGVEHT